MAEPVASTNAAAPELNLGFPRSAGLRALVRIGLLALLFAVELVVISIWLDTASLQARAGLTALIRSWGPLLLRSIVVAATIFVMLAYLQSRAAFQRVSAALVQLPLNWRLLAAHAFALACFAGISARLFASHGADAYSDGLAAAWIIAGCLAITLGATAFLPLRLWAQLVRGTGSAWAYALVAGAIAYPLGRVAWTLWKPTTALTFAAVQLLLRPFVSNMVVDSATRTIGTQRFSVSISPQCSGFEGAGLMLVFVALFLWIFRREVRFPRAFLLFPVGIGILWMLNAVRIVALILIGNAGAESVALGGFHSQAGWIAFNVVAVGLALTARRTPWLMTSRPKATGAHAERFENPAVPYLVPFLVILAAAMISRATSSGFEWLYPLRFFAAAIPLWYYRQRYARLDWKFGPISLVAGGGVFVLWVAMDRVSGVHAASSMPSALAAWPASARFGWITFRVLAAVVTVPIAEELAFRGFLLRRLISPDFEAVDTRRWTFVALLVSSLAFGLMHGGRWPAGTCAGLVYAWVLLRRGRLGDAVAAHATSNALLAAWVLLVGNWSFW